MSGQLCPLCIMAGPGKLTSIKVRDVPGGDSCTATKYVRLFDHLIGALLEYPRHIEAKRLGGLEIEY
jgi:hypothetical protein